MNNRLLHYSNDMEKMNKVKKMLMVMVLFIASLYLSYNFFGTQELNADDATQGMIVYGHYYRGTYGLSNNVLMILDKISYALFGINIYMAQMVYSVLFFGCMFLCLFLAVYNRRNWLMILTVMLFVYVPCSTTNKYHLVSTLFALIYLAVMRIAETSHDHKTILRIAACLILVFSVIFLNDKALFILDVVIPSMIYIIIEWLKRGNVRKRLLSLLVMMSMCLGVYRLIALVLCKWKKIDVLVYRGYNYSHFTDLSNVFQIGIGKLLDDIATALNVPLSGSFISFQGVMTIIRLLMAIYMLYVLFLNLRRLIKSSTEFGYVEAVLTIGTLIILLSLLLNGYLIIEGRDSSYGPIDNRYGAAAWFYMGVLLAYRIDEWEISTLESKKVSIAMIVLTILFSQNIFSPLAVTRQDANYQATNWLKQRGYYAGKGVSWSGKPIMYWSKGDIAVESAQKYGTDLLLNDNRWENALDGVDQCNFVVFDGTVTENYDIIKYLGKPVEEQSFGSYGKSSNTTAIAYDYDVRWLPEIVYSSDDSDIKMPDRYNVSFPLGTSDIVIVGENIENVEIGFKDYRLAGHCIMRTESKVVYQVSANQNVKTDMNLMCDSKAHIEQIRNQVTQAARIIGKDMSVAASDGEELPFDAEKGNYILIVKGKEIGDITIKGDDNILCEQISRGKEYVKYSLCVKMPGMHKMQLYNNGVGGHAIIKTVSYELPQNVIDEFLKKRIYVQQTLLDENSEESAIR